MASNRGDWARKGDVFGMKAVRIICKEKFWMASTTSLLPGISGTPRPSQNHRGIRGENLGGLKMILYMLIDWRVSYYHTMACHFKFFLVFVEFSITILPGGIWYCGISHIIAGFISMYKLTSPYHLAINIIRYIRWSTLATSDDNNLESPFDNISWKVPTFY